MKVANTKKNVKKSIKSKNSIKKELVRFVSICIFCIITLLSSASIYLTYSSTKDSLTKSLKETSKLVSDKVTKQIDSYAQISESVGLYQKNTTTDENDLQNYLTQLCSQYNLQKIDVLDATGVSVADGTNHAQDTAYAQAKNGNSFLTDPIIEKQDAFFEYAHPYEGNIVLMKIPYSAFSSIISSVKLGKTGSTYILNNKGAKVAHNDFSLVLKQQNNLEDVKTDPKKYKEVAQLETEMINGKTGFGFYVWQADKKFGSYAPIDKTNGWSVNVTALESEFMSGVTTSVYTSIILGIVFLVTSVFFIVRIAHKITKPIDSVVDAIDKVATGDLNVNLTVKRQDEIGIISSKLNEMVQQYRGIISDLSAFLDKISQGNLTAHSEYEYPGEFQQIRSSMDTIVSRLNDLIRKINLAADHVSTSSLQLSGGSQTLSQGATEQASSIEELSAAINQVSNQVKSNAVHSEDASSKVTRVSEEIEQSNVQMQNLITAMKQINDASSQIGKIIKTIEDIAFQTNILALNAAVEAARAGTAGKGFSVVADEVRNLASKSAQAAKNTTSLIDSSIKAVEEGTKLANETANSLTAVVTDANEVTAIVTQISGATAEQADAIVQITKGIDQEATVVQTNSATAEESAATAEELSSQAQVLKTMVGEFKLKDETPYQS